MISENDTRRPPVLVLASTSPRRQQLLGSLGVPFETVNSEADESFELDWSPEKIVTELAERKAEHGLSRFREQSYAPCIVIGADTIVVHRDTILNKPVDRLDAQRMLEQLQGNTHDVFTGVSVFDSRTLKYHTSFKRTTVSIKPMTSNALLAYLDVGESMDKAGAYAIQGKGALLVTHIDGCYYNVVGLPLSLLSDLLQNCDFPLV